MLSIRDKKEEVLPTERTGVIVYVLMSHRGQKFTTAQLAQRVGLTHNGAWRMLCKLSRKIPICQEIDGWVIY